MKKKSGFINEWIIEKIDNIVQREDDPLNVTISINSTSYTIDKELMIKYYWYYKIPYTIINNGGYDETKKL